MILYIHFGYLREFKDLYDDSDYLQEELENWTGIKWKVNKEADIERIERLLNEKEIVFDIV